MRKLKRVLHVSLCFVLLVTGIIVNDFDNTASAATVKITQTSFPESGSSASRTQTITLPNLKSITSVTVEPSNASFNYTVSGDQVTITAGGGSPTRSSYNSYKYSKYVTTDVLAATDSFYNPITYSDGTGYVGTLYKNGAPVYSNPYRAPSSKTVSTSMSQSGSCPSSSSISYSSGYYTGTLSATGCYVSTPSSTQSQTFTGSYTNTCTSTYVKGVYQNNETCSGSAPSSLSINSNGYVGSIPRTGTTLVSDNGPCSGCTYTRTRVWRADYSGTLSKTIPAVYTQGYSGTVTDPGTGYVKQNYTGYIYSGGYDYYYSYTVKINYLENGSPQFDLTLPKADTVVSNQTGYNSLFIKGTINKPDTGDTVTVKYSIDNLAAVTLQTLTTTGSTQSFGPFALNVNTGWTEGSHTLSVWSEDQLGAKSNAIIQTFFYDKTAPTAPVGLKSPRQSITSVDLAWDPSVSADTVDYQVYKNGVLLGNSNGITSYPIIGLIENTSYSFTVKAVDRGGNVSSESNPIIVLTMPWDGTPDTQAPSAPTYLSSMEITDKSVRLQWSPSTDNFGVMQYEIYNATTSELMGTATQTTAELKNLAPANTYRVKVRAKDAAGNASAFSSDLVFVTQPSTGPTLINADPATGSLQVPLDPTIQLNYSKAILSGLGINTITLSSDGTNVPVQALVDGTKLRIIPAQLLIPGTLYTLTVPANAITDLDGIPATAAYSSSFQTEASGQPDNLVRNNSFETPGTTLGIGDQWNSVTNSVYGWTSVVDATYGARANLSTAVPQLELQAQQLTLVAVEPSEFAEVTQQIAIGSDTPYQFGAWVQLAETTGTKATVFVEWLDEGNQVLGAFSKDVTEAGADYIHVTSTGVTPIHTTSALIHLRLSAYQANGKGEVRFDNVMLKLPDNVKPIVTLSSPLGTSSAPTIVSQATPTIQWNQLDTDIGTVFVKNQVQVWNSAMTSLIYDSGAVTYTGIGNQGSHTVSSSLKRNQDYQVRVRVFDGINWSDWSAPGWLRVQDVQEPNNTLAQATTAQVFTVYTGTIETASDVDYYKFTPQYTGLYHLTVKVPTGVNYDAVILNSSQISVASGSKPAGTAEELTFRVTAGETYYIKLSGVNGDNSPKAYSLGISRVVYNYQYNNAGRLLMMNVQKGLHLFMAEYKYDANGNLTDTDYRTIEVDE
ncbi:fibronectin type III domain-containing protein [Cohnella yongneupensis]|uniref:Fibronectin type III domain-containing protein n=1 Tax=Cohnella yongneupensis TaxID=425006 RepID=A0ABW0R2V5_9BACL